MLRTAIASFLLVTAGLARAGLPDMRATIPGSLHQCEDTSVFFFDTQDGGSKTLLLVSPADAAKLGSGTVSLTDALAQVTPIQKVEGITSADAAAFPFTLKVAENVAFSTFGFLSNGQGKNVKLDRIVMAALPGADNCLTGAVAAAPPASSATAPASPSSTAAPIATSSPVYASRFVTSTRPASSASTAVVSAATTVPASSSAALTLPPSSSANATAPAAAATSPVVIQAKYLLTSFVTISNESTTDGTISSRPIRGGHITGAVNGTILPIGMALFTPNATAPLNGTEALANGTAAADVNTAPVLLSASYSFTLDNGESVFVVAQTPLSQNYTSQALLLTLQSSDITSTQFSNITILGKPEYINSTMFRIDAYYINSTQIAA